MNRIVGMYARLMENPKEQLIFVAGVILVAWVLLNAPLYSEFWIMNMPHSDTGEDPTMRELMEFLDEDQTDKALHLLFRKSLAEEIINDG